MATWFEQDPARLKDEHDTMQSRFPNFKLYRNGNTLYWLGTLRPTGRTVYELMVMYPDNYPYSPPEATPTRPAITRSKHMYSNGKLCLFYPSDSADRTIGATATAATVVARSAAWFFAYEAWVASGYRVWPGPEAD